MWTPEQWYQEASAEAAANAHQVRGMAEYWMQILEREMPGVPRAEIVRRLEEENRKRLDAVPSLEQYPELRDMRDLVEASWRGSRDGAQMDDALLASHCGASYYMHRYVANGKVATGC